MILVDQPEREMECLLTDISARGLRLIADESLPSDSIVVVEAENHLVLCDVRNSQARGPRFALGAEKIHTMSKMELAPDANMADKTQALIEDYQSRIRNGLSNLALPDASLEVPAQELPDIISEELNSDEVDAIGEAHAPGLLPPLPPPVGVLSAPQAVNQPDPMISPLPIQQPELAAPSEPAVAPEASPQPQSMAEQEPLVRDEPFAELAPMILQPVAQSKSQPPAPPEPIAPSMETQQPHSIPVVQEEAFSTFDPLERAREAAFEAEQESEAVVKQHQAHVRKWSIGIGIAAGFVMLIGAAIYEAPKRFGHKAPAAAAMAQKQKLSAPATPIAQPPAPNADPSLLAAKPAVVAAKPVETPKPVAAVQPALAQKPIVAEQKPMVATAKPVVAELRPAAAPIHPASPPPVAAAPAPPVAVASARGLVTLQAKITVTEDTWATAFTDGKMVFAKLLVSSRPEQLEFTRQAVIRFGNAGAVQLTFGGKTFPLTGAKGIVRVVELTPAGFRYLGTPGAPLVAASPGAARGSSTNN